MAACEEAGLWADGDRFEYHVAAFLWDMSDPFNSSQPGDQQGGLDEVNEILTAVDNGNDSNSYWLTIADLNSVLSQDGHRDFWCRERHRQQGQLAILN